MQDWLIGGHPYPASNPYPSHRALAQRKDRYTRGYAAHSTTSIQPQQKMSFSMGSASAFAATFREKITTLQQLAMLYGGGETPPSPLRPRPPSACRVVPFLTDVKGPCRPQQPSGPLLWPHPNATLHTNQNHPNEQARTVPLCSRSWSVASRRLRRA